jgi:hypothetical protein
VQDGKSITLQTDDGSFGYETLAKFQGDGAAELYYDNSKKLETTSGGVDVTGTLDVTGVSTLDSDAEINGITVGRGGGNISTNIAIGVGAGSGTGTGAGNNVAIGTNALYSHTSGTDNIAIGYHCLYDITDGTSNVAIGRRTGQDMTGDYNTALGTGSLYSGVDINRNVGIGYEAGYNLAGDLNVAIGFQSGYYVTGSNNTILGGWDANESFSNTVLISAGTTERLRIDSSGDATFTGTVSDSKGNVRSIPQNTQASTYTLVAADAGKHILASGTVIIPNSIFSAGDAVTIINNTASDLTLTKTITTMYNTADDGDSDDRTLATRGMATILFASGTVAYISGAGLS